MSGKTPILQLEKTNVADHKRRCRWCESYPEHYLQYHDREWGVPVADDRQLFEMLVLDGMQAGLSWLTILKKRENFRAAFDGFEPALVAGYDAHKIAQLQGDAGIIRNRSKIEAAVKNAGVVLELQRQHGTFARYFWSFVDFRPICNSFAAMAEIPAQTALSQTISRDMKKRGMGFVGPTIIYALMQAAGMVNDHEVSCFRHEECRLLAEKFSMVSDERQS